MGAAGGTSPELRLVGRQAELARVERMLDDDRSATGHVRGMVLCGPTGMGRTCLLRAVAAAARARNCHVVEAVGSEATRRLPFGAVAPALAVAGIRPGQIRDVEALMQAASQLLSVARSRRLVVLLDNVHLADEGSMSLVCVLARRGGAFLFAAARDGEALPDTLHELWRGGLMEWLDLEPLDAAAIAEIAFMLTGEPVDAAVAAELARTTGGNPLFARELIRAASAQGLLVPRATGWHLRDLPRLPAPLTGLLWNDLADVPAPVLDVLELVGHVEPIEANLLADVVGAELVEHAQRLGLARVTATGRRAQLRLTNPMHGVLLRQRHAGTAVSRRWRYLAQSLADTGLRRVGDAMRLGSWHLNGIIGADADVLLKAIGEAATQLDHALVAALGRAVLEIDSRFPARLAVARGYAHAGEFKQAEELLRELHGQTDQPAERARVVRERVGNLFFGLGGTSAAQHVLETALGEVTEPGTRTELRLLRAGISSCLTRCHEAAEQGALRPTGTGPDGLWLHSVPVRINVLAMLGRTAEALECARSAIPAMEACGSDHQYLLATANVAWVEATLLHGELVQAESIAQSGYGQALRTGVNGVIGQWALASARTLLARGQLTLAEERFQESAHLLDASLTLLGRSGIRDCLGGLAIACALRGDPDTAAEAIRAADAVAVEGCCAPRLSLARAWLPAARGDLVTAQHEALAAARSHGGLGNTAYEASALHLAAVFGAAASVTARLDALATEHCGALLRAYAEHAAALAARDGKRLDGAATDFAVLGAPLLAAIAATDAAHAHAATGDTAQAIVAGERAYAYTQQCTGYRPLPTAEGSVAPTLTNREREVAGLATTMSNPEIAARMVLSVRTVETHLSHVYTKLGCSGRSELAEILTVPGPKTPPLNT